MADQLEPGSHLGPYVIVSALGTGGMGHVYRARDTRLDREVAIKVLSPDVARDEKSLLRLRREARTVAALSHPNLISIFDIGEDDGEWYLVTELLEGRTFRELMAEEGPLGAAKIREWGVIIAEAIGIAHARGVVHRDIKPENLFLTSDGRIKILDFGLARPSTRADDQAEIPTQSFFTEDGMILGSVGYMSPEQVRAETVGPPSDVFSIGCVLYEMASGRSPFLRKTPVATLTAILHDEPEPLTEVDDALRETIGRCLRKDLSERYSQGAELAAALARTPAAGPPHPAATRSPSFAMAAVVSFLALIVAVAAAAFLIYRPVHRDTTVRAVSEPLPASFDSEKLVVMLPAVSGFPAPPEYVAAAVQSEVERGLSSRSTIRVLPPESTAVLTASEDSEELLRSLGVDTILRMTVTGEPPALAVDIDVEYLGGARHAVSVRAEDLRTVNSLVLAEVERLLGIPKEPHESSPASAEAMQLYYEARYFWSKRSNEGVRRSIELFQKAIDTDPDFALAYAGLADAYAVLHNAVDLPARDTFPRTRAAASKALELDPDLVEAQISLAYVDHYYELDWKSAEAGYLKAIALRPDNATAHQWYAELLSVTGRGDEARREIEKALELDPLSPIISATKVWIELMLRDYDHAVEAGRTAIATNPADQRGRAYTGRAMTEKKRYGEAEKLLRTAADASGSAIMKLWLAETVARGGNHEEALKILRELEESDAYLNPHYHAFPYIALGKQDRALDLLEEAVEDRVEQRAWLGVDPSLDPLRGTARFQALREVRSE